MLTGRKRDDRAGHRRRAVPRRDEWNLTAARTAGAARTGSRGTAAADAPQDRIDWKQVREFLLMKE